LKETIGIAFCSSSDADYHCGLALNGPLIKSLIKTLQADHDFARLFAICIYWIIKEDLGNIKRIIICNDEPFTEVKGYLILLLGSEVSEKNIEIVSIGQYREDMGKELHPKPITYQHICSLWRKIDGLMKQ